MAKELRIIVSISKNNGHNIDEILNLNIKIINRMTAAQRYIIQSCSSVQCKWAKFYIKWQLCRYSDKIV
jgi:hypothetical protein